MLDITEFYGKMFPASDKTDAILVVDEINLHVNKALLSYHSDYFKKLFNSDFAEKSMPEITIEDLDISDFMKVLSLVHSKPIEFHSHYAERLLTLAERFQLPAAKNHIEFLMILTNDRFEKIRIADKFKLEKLLNNAMSVFDSKDLYKYSSAHFEKLSDETNIELFHKLIDFI